MSLMATTTDDASYIYILWSAFNRIRAVRENTQLWNLFLPGIKLSIILSISRQSGKKRNIFLLTTRSVLSFVQDDHTNKKTARRRNWSFTDVMSGILDEPMYVNTSGKNYGPFENICGNMYYSH